MQIIYNWQIFDYPISQEEPLSKYLTKPDFNTIERVPPQPLNMALQPMNLKSPIFSLVFCYVIDKVKSQEPEIQIFPEMTLFQSKLQISILEERRQTNYIYQLVKVQNCECFEAVLSFSAKIKFIEGLSSKVSSIERLISLVGSRKLNSHSLQTHSSIKKQLIIEEVAICEMKYNPKGYLLIRLTRGQDSSFPIWIQNVEALTWLCQLQSVKTFECPKILGKCKSIKLSPKQTYSVMFILPENLNGSFEVPVSIQFKYEPFSDHKFRMIKYLKVE